jgi:hypothetical protein
MIASTATTTPYHLTSLSPPRGSNHGFYQRLSQARLHNKQRLQSLRQLREISGGEMKQENSILQKSQNVDATTSNDKPCSSSPVMDLNVLGPAECLPIVLNKTASSDCIYSENLEDDDNCSTLTEPSTTGRLIIDTSAMVIPPTDDPHSHDGNLGESQDMIHHVSLLQQPQSTPLVPIRWDDLDDLTQADLKQRVRDLTVQHNECMSRLQSVEQTVATLLLLHQGALSKQSVNTLTTCDSSISSGETPCRVDGGYEV